MVRRSFTAVIEKNATFAGPFETEPYETGWASEARWFVRVLELDGELTLAPQLSPDGLFWCDDEKVPMVIRAKGLYTLSLRDFGNWLRLRGEFVRADSNAKVMIYLALKE